VSISQYIVPYLTILIDECSYSMMLADTVIVTDGETERPTKTCPSKWTDVAYFLEDDEEEEEEKPTKKRSKGSRNDDADFGRRTTRSREQDKSKEAAVAEAKRRKHQMELERKKREEVSLV
jgi:nucleosome binding factor SPN SPT16 subunit